MLLCLLLTLGKCEARFRTGADWKSFNEPTPWLLRLFRQQQAVQGSIMGTVGIHRLKREAHEFARSSLDSKSQHNSDMSHQSSTLDHRELKSPKVPKDPAVPPEPNRTSNYSYKAHNPGKQSVYNASYSAEKSDISNSSKSQMPEIHNKTTEQVKHRAPHVDTMSYSTDGPPVSHDGREQLPVVQNFKAASNGPELFGPQDHESTALRNHTAFSKYAESDGNHGSASPKVESGPPENQDEMATTLSVGLTSSILRKEKDHYATSPMQINQTGIGVGSGRANIDQKPGNRELERINPDTAKTSSEETIRTFHSHVNTTLGSESTEARKYSNVSNTSGKNNANHSQNQTAKSHKAVQTTQTVNSSSTVTFGSTIPYITATNATQEKTLSATSMTTVDMETEMQRIDINETEPISPTLTARPPGISGHRPLCDPVSHTGCDVENYERCLADNSTQTVRCQCMQSYMRDKKTKECIRVRYIKGSLTFLNSFKPELRDTGSSYYQNISSQVEHALMDVGSSLHSVLLDVHVEGFSEGSTKTNFKLALDRKISATLSDIKGAIQTGLNMMKQQAPDGSTKIKGTDLIMGNQDSPIDNFFDSITTSYIDPCGDPMLNYCDNNSKCINNEKSFSCHCEDSYSDVSPQLLLLPGEKCQFSCGCKNGGVCDSVDGEMMCRCINWFVGKHCELNGYLAFVIILCVFSGFILVTLITCCLCVIFARKSGKAEAIKRHLALCARPPSQLESAFMSLPRDSNVTITSNQQHRHLHHQGPNSTPSPSQQSRQMPMRSHQQQSQDFGINVSVTMTPPLGHRKWPSSVSHPHPTPVPPPRRNLSHFSQSHNMLSVVPSPPESPSHNPRRFQSSEAIMMSSFPHGYGNSKAGILKTKRYGGVSEDDGMSTTSEPIRCADELLLDPQEYSNTMNNEEFQEASRYNTMNSFQNPLYKRKAKSTEYMLDTGLSRL